MFRCASAGAPRREAGSWVLVGDDAAPVVEQVGERLLDRDLRLPAGIAGQPIVAAGDHGVIARPKPGGIDFDANADELWAAEIERFAQAAVTHDL